MWNIPGAENEHWRECGELFFLMRYYADTQSKRQWEYPHEYNLNTKGYEPGTINSANKFFRSVVRVEFLSAPGIIVGQEDVILESK